MTKLLTKALERRFKEIGSQENTEDPLVIAKFFGGSSASWYAVEYDEISRICYGYVKGLCPGGDEFGSWSIDELEAVRFPPFGLSAELDRNFDEKPLSEACPELKSHIERRKQLLEIEQQRQASRDEDLER